MVHTVTPRNLRRPKKLMPQDSGTTNVKYMDSSEAVAPNDDVGLNCNILISDECPIISDADQLSRDNIKWLALA